MRFIDYVRMVISLFYRRRWFHLIEIIIISLSMGVIMYSLKNIYYTYQGIIAAEKLIDFPLENVYNIKFGSASNISFDGSVNICNFVDDLVENSEFEHVGRFFYEGRMLKNNETEISGEIMYVDKEICMLSEIKSSITNKAIALETGNDNIGIAVGDDLKDKMPIGSIWIDDYSGVNYQVTDYIKKNDEWFVSQVINGEGIQILNTTIVAEMTTQMSDEDKMFRGYSFMNNVFLITDKYDKEQLKEIIFQYGDKHNLSVYVNSVAELEDIYINENKYYFAQINLQAIIFVVMSVIGLYIQIILSFESHRNMFDIMRRFGLEYKQAKLIYALIYGVICLFGIAVYFVLDKYLINSLMAIDAYGLMLMMKLTFGIIGLIYMICCAVVFKKIKLLYKQGS